MFNFLTKKIPDKKNKNQICSINFELNSDSTVNIVCHWPNFKEPNIESMDYIAQEYASMIHLITSGFFNSEILKTFDSLVYKDNENDNIFINKILMNWAKLLNYHKSVLEPLIKPSVVFKNNK